LLATERSRVGEAVPDPLGRRCRSARSRGWTIGMLDIKFTAEEIDSLEGPYVTRLPTFF
jgi:hypothetical protein